MFEKIIEYAKKHPYQSISIIIIFLVFIPISFYVQSPIGFIPKNEAGNVLSYYGALMGGGVTVFGVAWTLFEQDKQNKNNLKIQQEISNIELDQAKQQFELELEQKEKELEELKRQRREELSLQYKPVLSISLDSKDFNDNEHRSLIFPKYENFISQGGIDINGDLDINKNNIFTFIICLYNIGQGETVPNIDSITLSYNQTPINTYNCSHAILQTLYRNNKLALSIQLPVPDNYINIIKSDTGKFSLTIHTNYTDLVKNKYTLQSVIKGKLFVSINKKAKNPKYICTFNKDAMTIKNIINQEYYT